jgi:predicted Ser/Thr protein kinase
MKQYKEKLEEAKRLYESANNDQKYVLESLFPELKESEDEKIRKALISILKSDFEEDTTIFGISVDEIIAWLEKQGKKTSWKPSEEQMDALETAVSSLQSNTLERLYQDLKRETNYE